MNNLICKIYTGLKVISLGFVLSVSTNATSEAQRQVTSTYAVELGEEYYRLTYADDRELQNARRRSPALIGVTFDNPRLQGQRVSTCVRFGENRECNFAANNNLRSRIAASLCIALGGRTAEPTSISVRSGTTESIFEADGRYAAVAFGTYRGAESKAYVQSISCNVRRRYDETSASS